MDINILFEFVKYCNTPLPISIGVICHTDMSDGEVLKITNTEVYLYHFNKGYEQWWELKNVSSAETNLSKFGINKCLENYIKQHT